jgi:outer membrane protein assembly factor BamB
MGQSSVSDGAWPGSITVRMVGTARLASVLLALSLAACSSVAPTSAPESSAPAVATSAAPATPPGPPATADDWPFFRGDAARTGKGGSGPVGHGVLGWQKQMGGSVNSAVVIAGDLVYTSSDDDILHALDIDTGTEKWHFNPVNPQVSAPAYADGVIYAFDGVGTLFALDAATGGIRWHSAAPLDGPSGLTAGDGMLFLGTGGGDLVALDETSGSERWRYHVADQGAVHNPSFADGIVYAGSDRGGLVAVDAATGKLAWPSAFDTGTDMTGSVVIAGGIAYIGGTFDSITGKMSALDAKTGQLRWQLDRPFSSPAVADGVAYVGDHVGGLQAYDTATGKQLWRVPMERANPTVANGVVYVPLNVAHRVDAFDAATGAKLWQFDVDGGNTCCFGLAHGSVFAATQLGTVYRIDGDGSTIQPGPTPPPLASPTAVASASPLATNSPAGVGSPAQFLWSSAGGDSGLSGPGSMAIDAQDRLWVADTGNSRFAIFDPDGTFVEYWEHRGTGVGEFILQRPSSGDGYGAIAYAPDGTFYVLDVGNFRVEHFDAQRHLIKAWGGFGDTQGKFQEPVSIVVDATGVVSVLDDVRDVVEHYDQDGTVLGSFKAHPTSSSGLSTANSLAIDSKGNFYVSDCCSAGNQVQKLDPDGKLLLTIGPDGPGSSHFIDQPGSMAIDSLGRIFVDVGAIVDVFDVNGNFLDSFTSPGLAERGGFFSGLLLDVIGNGYVAEFGIDGVEKFQLMPPFAPTSASPSP